jgi:hypothetical protein
LFEIILGLAHIIWPEYDWGDERVSYFHFGNSRTLASWVSSMKFIFIGILFILAFIKDKERLQKNRIDLRYIWLVGAFIFSLLSFLEMSRLHHRIGLVEPSSGNPVQIIILSVAQISLLAFFVYFFNHVSTDDSHFLIIKIWAILWGIAILLNQLSVFIPETFQILTWLLIGWAFLFGGTFLVLYLGSFVLEKVNTKKFTG